MKCNKELNIIADYEGTCTIVCQLPDIRHTGWHTYKENNLYLTWKDNKKELYSNYD